MIQKPCFERSALPFYERFRPSFLLERKGFVKTSRDTQRSTGPALLLALLMGTLFLQGCMIKKGHTELGPFYYKRPLNEDGGTESAFLWPFFQKTSSDRLRQYAFRPFLNVRFEETGTEKGSIAEMQGLWPLFLQRKTEGLSLSITRIYPIFFHRRFLHPEGDEDKDLFLLPLLLTGRSQSEGSYFALFPLGGELKGIFGQDRIRFLLFPLYADARQKGHRSWNFLWPFFKYAKGEGKTQLRIFPFVGWKEREGWSKKFFFLWPFYVRVHEWLGSEHPTDTQLFLPFYGRRQTPFGRTQFFLYPFFSYHRNENPGNRYRAWQIPWPLLQITRGDIYHRTYLFPFWGTFDRKNRYHKDFVLYPIYWYFAFGTRKTLTTRRYVLPFYWDRRVTEHQGGCIRKRVKLWPLLDMSEDSEDREHLRLLSPLWFRDPEGFERNYGDFWTLYKREQEAQGMEDQRILWYRWTRLTSNGEAKSGVRSPLADEPVREEETGTLPRSPGEDFLNEMPFMRGLMKPMKEVERSLP